MQTTTNSASRPSPEGQTEASRIRSSSTGRKHGRRTAGVAAALLAAALGIWPAAARAQEPGYIICLPGGPGDTEMARPALATLSEVLAPLLGRKSITGVYTTSLATCTKKMNSGVLFALVPLSIYLNEGRKAKMVPVAQVVSPEMGGDKPRYHVMTKAAALGKLADLAGKKVAAPPIGDEKFIRRVVFRGQLPDSAQLVSKRSVVAAVKAVGRGEADAVIVDSIEKPRLGEIPGGEGMKEIGSSKQLLLPPVITQAANVAKVRKAVVALCKSARGKEACYELRLQRVTAATPGDYAATARAYGAP